ncbi:hypothetical protein Ddc_19376 [Ditylenchus destructor]|nr:hypothetical protein Ddc_19376 [Ditylenchus destructor]
MYQLFLAVIFLVICHQTEAGYGTNPTDGWDGMPTIGYGPDGRQTLYPNVNYNDLTPSTCPYIPPQQAPHTSQAQQYPPHPSQHPTPSYQPPYQPQPNTIPVFQGDDIGFEQVTDTRGGVPADAYYIYYLFYT